MKAAVYYENGSREVLRYEDVPDPQCPCNDLLVRVEAISVEGGDTVNRWGGPLAARPHIVGYQAAGEVIQIGRDVTGFQFGQNVTTTGPNGSHAALRAVPASTAWLLPAGMECKVAATLPIPFGTADNCLFAYGNVRAGDTVLIQSGASGVGVAAIQLAKRARVRAIATASSDARLAAIAGPGVDSAVNSAREDVAAAVLKWTDGKGVALALDGNGGKSLEAHRSSGLEGSSRVHRLFGSRLRQGRCLVADPGQSVPHGTRARRGADDAAGSAERTRPDRSGRQRTAARAARPRVSTLPGGGRPRVHRKSASGWPCPTRSVGRNEN